MNPSNVVYLIAKKSEKDKYGVSRETETKRRVFCETRSVGHRERSENGMLGLARTLVLSIYRAEWNGEDTVEFDSVRFTVYDANEYKDLIRLYIREAIGS